jgi:hypothetical protein
LGRPGRYAAISWRKRELLAALQTIAGPNRRGNVNFIAGPPSIYLDTASIRTHRRWERLNYVQLFTDLARDNQAFDAGFDSMGVRKSYLSPRE